MSKTIFLLAIGLAISFNALSQINTTPTYQNTIDQYREMASTYPKICRLDSTGVTDSGEPLRVLIIDTDGTDRTASDNKAVVLIMNAIHAGEPCGVNASISFAKSKLKNPDKHVRYCIIPIYNVGGALNRNSHSRANQNGPEEYGFRGNSRNLDLNRDFIKADSKNTLAFYKLFHAYNPHIFIDTHTSNGADYQPNMTLLSTFPEHLETSQSAFLEEDLKPYLYESMKERGDEMVPYVNNFRSTPDSGIYAFTDHPRYSIGYASLFHTIGFTTEAHMLKPYNARVIATRRFLDVIALYSESNWKELIAAKENAQKESLESKDIPFEWSVSHEPDSILFPGYEASYTTISSVTSKPTLRYDENRPYRKKVPYYKYHESHQEYKVPKFYLLKAGWGKTKELLDHNEVEYTMIESDTLIEVQSTYVKSYESFDRPYEGHYKHHTTEIEQKTQLISFRRGDIIIPTEQEAKKYLCHVFNPKSADSFFSWNFFDSCLGQKEYFSTYVFDQTAEEILDKNPELAEEFKKKQDEDEEFYKNPRAQLRFIYEHSPYYESSHLRLPVFEVP